jgi:3-oxoacyl-[acyl-carrier-protein] synthase II
MPSWNLVDPEDVAKQLDLVPNKARRKALKHVLSNSFGFGGVNASLVFSAI